MKAEFVTLARYTLLWTFVSVTIVASVAAVDNPCADGGRLTPIAATADGVGGTGIEDDSADGIGGTGRGPNEPDEGGIGGTGVESAKVGVLGTVTGFASICVGGTEIHYDGATTIVSGLGVADLAVGQVVEVVASPSRGGTLQAQRIEVRHEVSGPISAIDPSRGELTVLGETIRLDAGTWEGRAGEPSKADVLEYRVGEAVRVSGLRVGERALVASRVERIDAAAPSYVRGVVTAAQVGKWTVGGTVISWAGGRDSPDLGREVEVVGRWIGGRLQADEFHVAPRRLFDGRVERVQIEAVVRRIDGRSFAAVGGVRIDVAAPGVELQSGERVRIDARLDGAVPVVERLTPLKHPPARQHRGGALRGRPDETDRGLDGAAAGVGSGRHRPTNGDGLRPASPPRARQDRHPDLPARAQRPARVERPQRPARPQRPERPPRPERPVPPARPPRRR